MAGSEAVDACEGSPLDRGDCEIQPQTCSEFCLIMLVAFCQHFNSTDLVL